MDSPIEATGLTPAEAEQARLEAERVKAEQMARLDALGAALSAKRKEAIDYRAQSGIEQEWDEDDDAYNGLDEASKAARVVQRQRPVGQLMPSTDDSAVRSTLVLNVTKPYVNAFASKIVDMRLAINDRVWSFKPTPVPQIEEMKNSVRSVMVNGETVSEADVASAIMEKAAAAAKNAQRQVDDWMVESCWDTEVRRVIDDMARIGTGVLKGPFPEKCVYTIYRDGGLVQVESIEPRSKRISARNLFPSPGCGENIHDGEHLWELDYLTSKRLTELKDLPELGYIPEQIDAVLEEGPKSPESDPNRSVDPSMKSQPFQVWYFTGSLKHEELMAAGCECDEGASIPAIVTMVNNRVIRASLNPLDNGKFGYDVVTCSKREGFWAGQGIGRDLRTPQRMINGAVRKMMENAGITAGPQIILRQGVVTPADGSWAISPMKIWYAAKDADVQQVEHAFKLFNIDSRQAELMAIIQFALKMCEDVTGLPMILQGQQGQAPDVLGVVQILNENATSVARRVAKIFDDMLLEPHVGRYYDWLMQHGKDDSVKGDYTIDVQTPPDVMADKAALNEMIKFAPNPVFEVSPKKLFAEIARANRIDPSRIQYTAEELKRIQSQPQPQDPRIAVAELGAKLKELELRVKTDEGQKDREHELMLKAIETEMEQRQLAGERSMSFDDLKAMLAKTAMQLRVQRELSFADIQANLHAKQVANPPTEPAGRAASGKAYQA